MGIIGFRRAFWFRPSALLVFAALLAALASCHTQRVVQRSPKPARKVPVAAPAAVVKSRPQRKVFGYKELAQTLLKPRYLIALFAPLDLSQTSDSGFSVSGSQPLAYGSREALEAYEGTLMALDSLQRSGMQLELQVVDTRSRAGLSAELRDRPALDSCDLWLGMLDARSLPVLAREARTRRINLVSLSYPNDAGVKHNPFVFICNSTLKAHCEAIERLVRVKYHPSRLILLRGPSAAESQIQQDLTGALLSDPDPSRPQLLVHQWTNNSYASELIPLLRAKEPNILVLSSLYPQAALNILTQLDSLTASYPLTVIGMPTLDGQTLLKTHPFFGMNILYSSPYRFRFAGRNQALLHMMWSYFRHYKSRPSDAALKAYEGSLLFSGLLRTDGKYFNRAATNSLLQGLVNLYRFTPRYGSEPASDSAVPDFIENTHLYFYQIRDGVLSPAN